MSCSVQNRFSTDRWFRQTDSPSGQKACEGKPDTKTDDGLSFDTIVTQAVRVKEESPYRDRDIGQYLVYIDSRDAGIPVMPLTEPGVYFHRISANFDLKKYWRNKNGLQR